ncbi:MAG: hypothetical protein ACLQI7_24830 [Streptosporangiaceae bacterium]
MPDTAVGTTYTVEFDCPSLDLAETVVRVNGRDVHRASFGADHASGRHTWRCLCGSRVAAPARDGAEQAAREHFMFILRRIFSEVNRA